MRRVLIRNFIFSIGVSKNYVAVIAGLMLLAACKKDNNGPPPHINQFENLRLKIITGADAAEGWQAVYTYDTQKRVTRETEILYGTDTSKISDYNYSGNKIAIKITENSATRYKYYELTPQGYVKTDTTSDGIVYTHTYDDKGFVVKSQDNQTPRAEINYYYHTATGLLDSSRLTVGNTWVNSQTYKYDMERENSLENKNLGMPYYGNKFLSPYTHNEYRYLDGGIVKTQLIDYLFTYDEIGRIKSKSYESAGQRITYHYTYY